MTDAPPTENPRHGDAPPAASRPPLRRSRDHKVLSGVCGGLGRFFDLDPVIFRVVLGVLAVTGGFGLIVYGFAWLLIPLEGEEENEGRRMLSGRVDGPALTAVLCALVGCGLFLSLLNNSGAMSFSLMLTVVLVGTAYWSQQRRTPDADEETAAVPGAGRPVKAQKAVDAPPETQAPPPPAVPSWWRDQPFQVSLAVPFHSTGYLWGPDDGPHDGTPRKERRGRPARDGRQLGGWTALLALVAFSAGTGLTWRGQPLGTSLETGLACALAVYGLGIGVSSRYGRTGGGTVTAAVLTALLLVGAAALPKSVTTEWRRVTWRPVSAAELRPEYEVGTGVGTLDLSGLSIPAGGQAAGKPLTARAEAGAGQLKVVLPDDVTAKLTVEVGIGSIKLPDDGRRDVDVKPRQSRRVTVAPRPGHASRGTLELRLKAGLGEVEVTRAAP
ncbi:PspC domain-containing protein [Streptomyces huiliensis]|uniref:PspC domain-containing protein n=1 Tax=Streptomyces huiliensis TaxID=2876027 RepID=UPI001CBFF33A|nr:PspC domain-containing protein [Streptomyces huiliensis]